MTFLPPARSRLLAVPAALTLLLALAVSACSDTEDEPGPTPTPAGSIATVTPAPQTPSAAAEAPTPTPAQASPTVSDANDDALEYRGFQTVGDFTTAPAIDFPENLLMVVETGCNQCDGPTEALYRVWRNSGETHVELLVDAAITGAENPAITSFALKPDLSDMVVTVCTDCGAAGGPLIESPVKVYRSLDGGITWREIHSTPAGNPVFVQAITQDGIVLSGQDGGLYYWRGDPIQPPPGDGDLLHDSNRTGQLRWLAEDGSVVLDAAGKPIALVEPGSLIDAVALDGPDLEQAIVGWAITYVSGPFDGWTVTRIGPDGRHIGFRSGNYVSPVVVLEDGRVAGNLSGEDNLDGGNVGFIDALRGTLTPIHGPLLQPPFGNGTDTTGRNTLQAVLTGPFLRVTTGINCLPIRVSTENRSRELTCAADGTLVYDLRNTITVGGQQWARVRLLDGREGYAVAGFLTPE